LGINKKLPIHKKLNHTKVEILKLSSLARSSGLKF